MRDCFFGDQKSFKTDENKHNRIICHLDQQTVSIIKIVALLDQPFRGYKTYHRYSEKQIQETKKWILFVAERDNIDPRVGLVQWIKKFGAYKAFEWNEDAYNGKVKGLITHTNVSRGNSDCYPDPRLVEMLLSL